MMSLLNNPDATTALSTWEKYKWSISAALLCLLAASIWPARFCATFSFVVNGMIDVAPLVIPGIAVSAWVNASAAGNRIKQAFDGNRLTAILLASTIGTITPVCGVTVLPLMTGLLASGVPLAPVMAFWLSSPVTDPAMFSVTAATLGFPFAIAKTLAAFSIGFMGGVITACISPRSWTQSPLRQTGLAATLGNESACSSASFVTAIWKHPARIRQFKSELWAMTKLIAICLGLAFAAEHLMRVYMQPQVLAEYVGKQSSWAIPLAVFVGSPAYFDGYAALPLTRGLIDHGMSPGAAMAFLVSGSVVSVWGAIAIFPVLRARPFFLYLSLAVLGSLASGWLYDAVT
jgi:hypothetical protein